MHFQKACSLAAALLASLVVGEAKAQCVGTTCYYPSPPVIGFQQGYSIRPTLFGGGWRIKPRLIPYVIQQQASPVYQGAPIPMQLQAVPHTYYRYQWGFPAAQPSPAQQPQQPSARSTERSILTQPSAKLTAR